MLCTESRRNIIVAQLKDEFHRRGVASYSTIRDDGIRGCGRFLGDRTERFSYVQS